MAIHLGTFKQNKKEKRYLPLRYGIGESIYPEHWDKIKCRAIEQTSYPQYTLLNVRLRLLENMVHCFVLELKNNNIIPTRNELRVMLDNKLKKNKIIKNLESAYSLVTFIELYIKQSTYYKARGTIRQYHNTLRLLKNFSKETGRSLALESIDMAFYAEFRRYMYDKGHTDAYFGNQIKFIRLFMNEATEQGYNKQLIFKSRKFSCFSPDVDKIYLKEDEINKIQYVPIEDNILLSVVRDLFIVGCRTGLRFSDLIRLNPTNFSESENILRVATQKTNDLIYIPLTQDVMEICKKYCYSLPRISNAIFNINIKQVACMAGVEDKIEVLTRKGKNKTYESIKKYKLVSAHTARRSFATNAYLGDVPTIAIMRITGHRTERAFMRYIRIASENNARQLLTHPHFSKISPKTF
ncbi:MAG: site-specific integrase [Prevotellaceae bacterium]|jgi:integrase|nr:site-specific integrase [Prevotellaceae bacterium]